ncbi:hypothetical protein IC620_06035 [Hazenella sp. IB182357]|uniref:Uncharacterized protein n=1 Tax=Polycladospora coralii TaxID=2771432 RepID=A0A926N904_9BACL|nr:hypothetical protein [Polycladospora coralii]MBD1371918.1 hypothetical protein [Polycladospora coralii]MBS7529378.1 hypothetical protein [Polycladospora coralii]
MKKIIVAFALSFMLLSQIVAPAATYAEKTDTTSKCTSYEAVISFWGSDIYKGTSLNAEKEGKLEAFSEMSFIGKTKGDYVVGPSGYSNDWYYFNTFMGFRYVPAADVAEATCTKYAK